MNSSVRVILSSLCVCAAGVCASEVLYRATWSRNFIGELLGRGELLAVVHDRAIYERDLFTEPDAMAETMWMAEILRRSGGGHRTSQGNVARELDLLNAQFGDKAAFAAALEATHLTRPLLSSLIADHLEVRQYLEARIAAKGGVTAEECRERYEGDSARFESPRRFRARHIFVAAPGGTRSDVVIGKGNIAGALSIRLLAGENFAQLAGGGSEDEATKASGGDLGWFSAWRMPAEFIAELEKLQVGQTSAPFRSPLGFHIVQLTDVRPGRALSLEEVQAEIANEIANEKRSARVASEVAAVKQPGWSPMVASRE